MLSWKSESLASCAELPPLITSTYVISQDAGRCPGDGHYFLAAINGTNPFRARWRDSVQKVVVFQQGDGLDKKSDVIDGDLSKSRSPSSQALHKRSLSSHFNTLISQFRRKSIPSTPVLPHRERRTPERRGKSIDREEESEVCEIMDDNDIISFSRVRSNTNKLYFWYNMNKNRVSMLCLRLR